jgi:threonine dehydrogenase-like Zn-dependent dehydrogenase
VRWARALGARHVVVVDPVAQRLPYAIAGGATTVIAAPAGEAGPAVKAACGGAAPRVVIDSTGHAGVFAAVLGLVADRGRVVVLGDTGSPASQKLTSDVITRGLTITGAHDCHNDAQWDNHSICSYLFNLVEGGRFPLAGLISDVFAPGKCVEAYAAANARRGDTMGICFDWTAPLPELAETGTAAEPVLAPPGAK